ncbi:MAG TPA: alcohol dehydrogenase catalytic domain-containing protein [Kofleriaceae bacterium]|nr:alcohol dehydrogenase catalytic domain-containing protein [Kofleriaceae bacterium]
MRAYVFDVASRRASLEDVPEPAPAAGEVAIAVEACGLCRTDLHILDGDLQPPGDRVVLGHQVIGRVRATGAGVDGSWQGRRVGVPWLATSCGHCRACTGGRENLCPSIRCTGLHRDGGLAEVMVAAASSCLPVPDGLDALAAAPLLCAGAIGWRALRLAGGGERVGVYGFGAAAHLLAQVLRWQRRALYAFTRPGDRDRQAYARSLGAAWAGGSDELPPEPLDAAIIFADDGALVPQALAALAPGGTVVCGEIHMTEIPSFPYDLLWREKVVRSVANLTHQDGVELLEAAARIPLRADVRSYPLADVEHAFADLRAGRVHGAAVVRVP